MKESLNVVAETFDEKLKAVNPDGSTATEISGAVMMVSLL